MPFLIGSLVKFVGFCEHIVTAPINRFHSWLIKRYDGGATKEQKVFLTLFSTDDHNNALVQLPSFGTLDLHRQRDIKIVYKNVTSTNDINELIGSITKKNRIIGLRFVGHGSPFSIGLKKENLNFYTLPRIQGALNLIEKGASIVLDCCLVGKKTKQHPFCFADWVAQLAPGHEVFAPTRSIPIFGSGIYFHKGRVTANFVAQKKSSRKGFIKKIQNIFYGCLFALTWGTYCDPCTVRYKYSPR